MPDQLFAPLQDDVVARPLPAAEVRRRGDRRRRGRLAAAVTCLAAVAAIATPLALSQADTDSSMPPVATSPDAVAPSPAVTLGPIVPADFPLTAGMPHEKALETMPLTTEEEKACGTVAWAATQPVRSVDGATVSYHDGSEGGQRRSIALYADGDQAASALQHLETALACGSVDDGSGTVTRLATASAGDPSRPSDVWVIRWTDKKGRPTGEGMISSATRVGNALLLDSATFMSAGDDAVVQHEAARLAAHAATVIAAMHADFGG